MGESENEKAMLLALTVSLLLTGCWWGSTEDTFVYA